MLKKPSEEYESNRSYSQIREFFRAHKLWKNQLVIKSYTPKKNTNTSHILHVCCAIHPHTIHVWCIYIHWVPLQHQVAWGPMILQVAWGRQPKPIHFPLGAGYTYFTFNPPNEGQIGWMMKGFCIAFFFPGAVLGPPHLISHENVILRVPQNAELGTWNLASWKLSISSTVRLWNTDSLQIGCVNPLPPCDSRIHDIRAHFS